MDEGGYLERDKEGVRHLVSTVPCTQFSPEWLCIRLSCLWTGFSYLFLDGVQHPRASFFFENRSQEHDAL